MSQMLKMDSHTFTQHYLRRRFEVLMQNGFEIFQIVLSEVLIDSDLRAIYMAQVIEPTFALAENYPQLKADESFRLLQARISSLEEGIADRRELYNEQVQIINTRIDQYPSNLIARRYGFTPKALLEFSAEEKSDVDVGALFQR
jgi:hypothetical protein